MKYFYQTLIALLLVVTTHAAEWEQEYAGLLKRYVTPSGVRYAAFKANGEDMAALKRVVDGVANARVAGKGKEALAFHLNAYNAWILHEALEKYPTKSVKDTLLTFFTSQRITVAGEKMSFNRLEKDIIRPRFNEPRIHFALNCASRSCPALRAEPFTAGKLDAQLDEQTRLFVNSSNGVVLKGKRAELSKVFEWYAEDFSGGVVPFVNKYRSEPLPAGATIAYQNYDWGLNTAK